MSIPTGSPYIGRDAKSHRKAPPFGYVENLNAGLPEATCGILSLVFWGFVVTTLAK
jgi:hypothetical protein